MSEGVEVVGHVFPSDLVSFHLPRIVESGQSEQVLGVLSAVGEGLQVGEAVGLEGLPEAARLGEDAGVSGPHDHHELLQGLDGGHVVCVHLILVVDVGQEGGVLQVGVESRGDLEVGGGNIAVLNERKVSDDVDQGCLQVAEDGSLAVLELGESFMGGAKRDKVLDIKASAGLNDSSCDESALGNPGNGEFSPRVGRLQFRAADVDLLEH